MPEISFSATVGICSVFIGADGEKRDISMVIYPTHADMPSEERMKVSWGCNMWKSCNNPDCYYSIASREASRQKKNP